jgi:hypothetical protein
MIFCNSDFDDEFLLSATGGDRMMEGEGRQERKEEKKRGRTD